MSDFLLSNGYKSNSKPIGQVNFKKDDKEVFPSIIPGNFLPPDFQRFACFDTQGQIKMHLGVLEKSNENGGVYVKNIMNQVAIKVINLERRQDRWLTVKDSLNKANINNYERFLAVDGSKLDMTPQLKYLFRGNDFNFAQGAIGCALSHINLWKELILSDKDYYVIFEDDIEFAPDFNLKLNTVLHQLVQEPYIDLSFLGHFYWKEPPVKSTEYPVINKLDGTTYMGGTWAYIISKAGACKYLNIIKHCGIQCYIDRFINLHFDRMQSTVCEPHIVYSDYVTTNNNVDSDIQRNFNPVGQTDRGTITPLLHAGLGNQFFMIANAYAVAKRNNLNFTLNSYYFGSRKPYYENIFKNIKRETVNFNTYHEYREPKFTYNKVILGNLNNHKLYGYYQSAKYFDFYKEDILNLFKFPEEIENFAIERINSICKVEKVKVAVHIRRGDYVGSDLHYIQPLEYYKNAMLKIEENLGYKPAYIYFSDDKQWVRDNFSLSEDDVIIDESMEDYQEFAVMSKCHHFIIANSTFSWWAAWLSQTDKDKIVIAPSKWFIGTSIDSKDIIPDDWVQIN